MIFARCGRASPRASAAASPSDSVYGVRGHRSYLCKASSSTATGPKAAAANISNGPGGRRPQRKSSAAEVDIVQSYLQEALGLEAPAAHSVAARASLQTRQSVLQLSTCQGWVACLLQLTSGDSAAVRAMLQAQPQLLCQPFDNERHAKVTQIQHLLYTFAGIHQRDLIRMLRRYPMLLAASPHTIAAAAQYLLSLPGGGSADLHLAVLDHPQLMASSVELLQAKMQWLTGTLGMAPTAALRLLSGFVGRAISTTLEPHRLWLLQQDFTPPEVIRLAQRSPPLFALSIAVLQQRLNYFTQSCGVPPAVLRRMLVREPTVWTVDLDGQLMQAKLQYWQHQLGYSLSDLPLVPCFLKYRLTRIVRYHSFLEDLLSLAPSPVTLSSALARGSTAGSNGLGARYVSQFVRQHLGNVSVHELLQPLVGRLSQPALRKEWKAALDLSSAQAAPSSTSQWHALYAALHDIYDRDWALSAAGLHWLATEAAAKAADSKSRAAQTASAVAAVLNIKQMAALAKSAGKRAAVAPTLMLPGGTAPAASTVGVTEDARAEDWGAAPRAKFAGQDARSPL